MFKIIKKYILLLWFCCTAVSAGVAGRFPDASVVLLESCENTLYRTDGTSETRDFSRYRIMNYDGVLKMRTLNMHFNSTYGTLQVKTLSLLKSNGRKIDLDPAKTVRTGIDPEQMSSRIYDPAQKSLTVNVPELEAGDTLTVETLRRTLKPRIPGEWSDICVMQADFPILDAVCTIDAPAEKPLLAIAVKDEVKGTLSFSKKTSGGRIIYSWRARNVPQAIPEPAMPALYTCCQRILVSTVKDWQSISRWYSDLCAPQLAKVNDAMREKTAALTAGKKDDMAKINALFQFVSQQIRYTGITGEANAPGYEPHPVSQTFDRRHGVCRDKAALLAAMLRLAELEAYPVLFMSGTPKDADVPNIYFNHAIVAAVSGGKYILMDPTFETTRELLPSYLAGDSFLVAKPEGDTLRTVPAVPAENNLLAITTSAQLDTGGTLNGSVELNFTGTYDQMYRAAFSQWHLRERNDFFAAQLQKVIPGAAVEKVEVIPADIRDMSVPLSAKIDFRAAGNTVNSGKTQFFTVPRFARTLGLLDTLYSMTALQKRHFPLRALPRAVKESIKISLPENHSVISLPENSSLEVPGVFRFKFQSRSTKGRLTENCFYAVDSMLVSPAEYPELKKSLAAADRKAKTLPLIKISPDLKQENSILLDHDEKFAVHSSGDWEHTTFIRRKILNYAGMKEFSEVRIPYFDGIDTVEISGSVTAPDGTTRTLSAGELNRMDAPGAAAMPRYPRKKIAVASFPNVIPGSIIEYSVKRQIRRRLYFTVETAMQDYTPALKRTVTFSGAMPVNVKFSGNMKYQEKRTGGNTVFSACNIPAFTPESGVPPLKYFAPAVSGHNVSAPAEMREKINRRLQKKVAAATSEIARTSRKIAAGKVPADAIDAIRKYVSTFVRETDYPFYQQWAGKFSAPEQTLKDGYGSSADRAILLAAMLNAAGIKTEFVLSTSGTVPANTALSEWSYNYPDVLLYLPENGGIFLNDLGLHGTLGARRNAGSKLLFLTPQMPQTVTLHRDRQELESKISIRGSGDATLAVNCRYSGRYFENEAERFAKFTPELRKRHFQHLAAAISPAAKTVSAEVLSAGEFFEIKMVLEIPRFAVQQGKYVSCDLPGYALWQNVFRGITPQTRQLPFVRPAHDISLKYTVTFPEKWQVFSGPGKHSRGTLYIEKSSRTPAKLLSPAEYISEAEKVRNSNRAENRKILFITE